MLDRQQAELTSDLMSASDGAPTPSPIVIKKELGASGTIVYGLVARVAMSQPGFGFRIEHDLPVGVELVDVRPKAKVVGDHLIWQFGRVDPGQEVRLQVVIRPFPDTVIQPEELAVFTATYSHNLYFQVPVVRPRVTARLVGPPSIALGDEIEFSVEVANVGSCAANQVRATVSIPPGLKHDLGTTVSVGLGSLNAGELQRVSVPVVAVQRGSSIIRAAVTGPNEKEAIIELPVDVK